MNRCTCAYCMSKAVCGVFNYKRLCYCKACRMHRDSLPRVCGPYAGRLWRCYRVVDCTLTVASGMSPEQAYNNWLSYSGATS